MGCGGFRWCGFRGWGSCEAGWTAVGWLCRRPHGFCPPGVVGVAHSRALGVGGNRGIMRNSTISSERGPAPMCADPPDRTWEPDRHTQLSPENPVISTKNSPRPIEVPASHVQHRRQPHPPGTPHRYTTNPPPPTRHCPRCPDTLQSRAGTRPISARNTADLEPEVDRSRHGVRPISRRKWTDLGGAGNKRQEGSKKGEDLVVLALVGMRADSRAGSGRLTPEALRRGRSALVGTGQRCSSRARSAARVR